MRFLVDAQLPPALAAWLEQAGHDASHVRDIGLREAEDEAIWAYALRIDAVILTKDEDFAARAAHMVASPPIVWLRVGNTTNRALMAWIDMRFAGIVKLLNQGDRLIEVI